MSTRRFDDDYYARYYLDPDTRVISAEDVARLGRFVCSYIGYLELPMRRVLDMGCGLGHWRPVIAEHFPEASYTGVEVSEYLCQRYGFQQGSITDYVGRGRFDLVICQGVLQYLEGGELSAAIDNLARLCRGVLYLEVLTREDWQQNCDQERTDGDVHLRTARTYRRHLSPHFITLGGGLFLARSAPVTLYELEKLE